MRKVLIAFFGIVVAAVLAAYFWNRTAQNRIVEAMDLAVEETERLWATDFSRPALFLATAVEQEVALPDADSASADTDEESADEDQPAVDASDATSYYREAESALGDVKKEDRLAVQQWLDTGEAPENSTALADALDRGSRAIAFIEKGLAQTRCSPWDTPMHGPAMRLPSPQAHRYIHSLFLVRAGIAMDAGRNEDAATDLLRALAYSQDLCRHSMVATRFQFSPLQSLAAARMQDLIARAPLGQSILDSTLKGLTVLDEIDPPASQSLQMERLAQLIGLGRAATTDSGPGRVPFWAGIFDFSSAHEMADAAQATTSVFDRLEKSIDEPMVKSASAVENAADQLRRSTNPIVSNLVPHPERLQAVVAETTRQLRMAEIAAAVQLYRLNEGDFPGSIAQLKGKGLKRLPIDPVSGDVFVFRPPDEASPAKLTTPGDEDRMPKLELTLQRTMAPSVSPDTLPAGALRNH